MTRGGARKGSGRKPLGLITRLAFRAKPELKAKLKAIARRKKVSLSALLLEMALKAQGDPLYDGSEYLK